SERLRKLERFQRKILLTMRDLKIAITFLTIAAGAIGAGCGTSANSAEPQSNNAPVSVEVTTAQAEIRPIPSYIEATGNLASDEQTDVAPTVGGKIVDVTFDIGSYVSQGDVLVRLDPRDASIRLEQARAQVQ